MEYDIKEKIIFKGNQQSYPDVFTFPPKYPHLSERLSKWYPNWNKFITQYNSEIVSFFYLIMINYYYCYSFIYSYNKNAQQRYLSFPDPHMEKYVLK